MGVKGLWELVSPTGELVCLSSLAGQAVAVDLAGWLVDTQSLHLGHAVTRPHFRNLFFRTVACLQAGVVPVMVLEGDAPSLKWGTISSRNQRNFGSHHGGAPRSAVATKTGKRTRFNAILKKCSELFDLLGVPWVRAAGEAEATCAALNYHQVVQGVISQDSDVFLYGGSTVFRNFTANQKVTAEKFRMDLIDERLQVTRGGMMLLAIVLGCDYLPGGVHGVGKDTVLRFLRVAYSAGDRDPTQRLKLWAAEHITAPSPSELASTKWKKGSDDVLEDGLKKRIIATEGFPFTELLAEFRQRLPLPLKKVKWSQPDFEGLVWWCVRVLEWEVSYVLEKVVPIVTRWTVTEGAVPRPLQPVSALKRCVRQGVVCLRLQWRMSAASLPPDTPEHLTTEEPLELLRSSLPHLVQQFEDLTLAAKKGKKKTNTKKSKETQENKENKPETTNTITRYLKPVPSGCDPVSKATTTATAPSTSDRKAKNGRNVEDKLRIKSGFTSTKKDNSKDQHGVDGEVDEEDEDEQCDERELSFIIDRIMNIRMDRVSKPHAVAQTYKQGKERNECEQKQRSPLVQNMCFTDNCVARKMEEETRKDQEEDISNANDSVLHQPSLFERASKILSMKGNKQSEPSCSSTKTRFDPFAAGDISSDGANSLVEPQINTILNNPTIGVESSRGKEVRTVRGTHTKTSYSPAVEVKTRPKCCNVSTDMFEDTVNQDSMNITLEEALSEDSLITSQDSHATKTTGGNSSSYLVPEDYDWNSSSLRAGSPATESGLPRSAHQSVFPGLSNDSFESENDDLKIIVPEEDTKMRLQRENVGFENDCTEKQNNECAFSAVVQVTTVEGEPEGARCLESASWDEDADSPLARHFHNSTHERSCRKETPEATTPHRDGVGYHEDAKDTVSPPATPSHHAAQEEDYCAEEMQDTMLHSAHGYREGIAELSVSINGTSTPDLSHYKTVRDVEVTSVSSPQKRTETSLNEIKDTSNIAKFNPKRESGTEGHVWSSDYFSPVEVTLPLAQRLKLKCSDKRFIKLLDDLR